MIFLKNNTQQFYDEGMTTSPSTMEANPRRITRSMTKGEAFPSFTMFSISLT